ncbi:MAG: hypothetical protein ACYCV7_13385 [Acidimicrobiales bacterium]
MSTQRRHRSRLSERDDEGQALIIVLVLSVALILGVTTAVSSAIANLGFSASYGNTSQAQLTAFSGLSQATSAMATAGSISALPCAVLSTNMPLPQTGGGNDSYSVSIAYFSDPAATASMACNGSGNTFGTGSPAGTPASAILTSTGAAAHTTPVVMQEKVSVNAVTSLNSQFDFAMLSSGTVNLTHGLTVTGTSANVYGGAVNQCANNASIDGSVQAAFSVTSNVTIGNACQITGNLYVNGSVTIGNNATVGGNVYAYGGSVTLSNNATVGGSVYASGGSVALQNSATVGGSVYAYGNSSTPGTISIKSSLATAVSGSLFATGAVYDSSPTNVVGTVNQDLLASEMPALPAEPITQLFPQLDPTVASLTNAGYSVIQLGGSSSLPCSDFAAYASPTTASPVAAAYTTPTAIYAPTCTVSLSGTNTFDLSSNMVWVVGGLTNKGNLTVQPTLLPTPPLAGYDLSIVVPTGTSCPSGDLTFKGDTNVFSSSINVLFYTPCSVTLTGVQTLGGQVLAGTSISTKGSFALTYSHAAAETLPGAKGDPTPVITVTSKTVHHG